MMAFRYSYQSIVNLKASETTQAEWMLTAAVSQLRAEEMSLEELRSQRRQWEDKLTRLGEQGSTLIELQQIQYFIRHLDKCIGSKELMVRAAEHEVLNSRHKLSERKVQEKIWLKSKDKAWQKFKSSMLAVEQAELDEIAVQRHARTAQL
ncbi:flagellar FliJ protein [Paenibacillaceae bacterium GAS479]|nr:flagellar FliJ protein [Paenibacillaceae bacterium GAS479]